jgi:ribosome-binding protein aMBF1 (putative translation factor)
MARNDQWCELCEDRTKSYKVKIRGREFGVCNPCKYMCDEDELPRPEEETE